MFALDFPMQKLIQQRRQGNVAFLKKQRITWIVIRKLRAAHPNIPPEPVRTCKLMRMTGSKKYSPVGTKAQPRVGLDF